MLRGVFLAGLIDDDIAPIADWNHAIHSNLQVMNMLSWIDSLERLIHKMVGEKIVGFYITWRHIEEFVWVVRTRLFLF